ncbi:MAG TPA: DUF4136 domain-containing protein [Thermoanaerobaculia bacterium]|jgi:hypothetical protein
MRHTLTALALIVLPACASLQVKTEQDLETDFSRYHTYAWIEGVPGRDPSLESQIQTAVDRELPFKRLHRVEKGGSPDLYVSICVTVDEDRVVQPDQWGYDLGTVGMSDSRVSVLTLPRGTLLVDLIDSGSRRLVWRGQASQAVDREASEETIRKAVREVFRPYPPDKLASQEKEIDVARPPRKPPVSFRGERYY